MSSGRWAKRGRVYQGRADAGWALANGGAGTVTYKHPPARRLIGTRLRSQLEGTSVNRPALVGTDIKTRSIEGPSQ